MQIGWWILFRIGRKSEQLKGLKKRIRARQPERALHFGRDNRLVLESILGYSPERIDELEAAGVLR